MNYLQEKKPGIIYVRRGSFMAALVVITALAALFMRTESIVAEKITCSAFKTLPNGFELAQEALKSNPRLDADKDGVACENLK